MTDASLGALFDQVVRDLKGAWRYRWLGLVVATGVCVIGWFAVLALPDVYEARARVFVDTSSRLREVLGTIAFQPDIQSRVNIVRQAMMGGPQLERVAQQTGLITPGLSADGRNRLISGLADQIEISAGRANVNRNMFSITYANSDRAVAVAVVDALLNSFVEDVIQQKTRGADAAQNFLREQIGYYERQLAQADARLAEFKRQNVGLLPGEGQDYFSRMQLEVSTLEQLQSDLAVAQSRRDELQRQLAGEIPFLPESDTTSGVGSSSLPGGEIAQRISQLERSLDEMLLRYTEAHPDVRAAQEQLEQLRTRRAEELRALTSVNGGVPNANNPVYQEIQISLNEMNVDIAAIQAQIRDAARRVDDLRSRLDTMPEVEAEFSRLTRDYTSTKALYDQLVSQLERERLVNEGDDQQVVDFQIIDPPAAGADPVAPRRSIFLMAVLVAGLGAGGGFAYLLNMLWPVFADGQQLRRASGLPVVGVISLARRPADRIRARTSAIAYCALVACLMAAGLILVILREPSTALVQQWIA